MILYHGTASKFDKPDLEKCIGDGREFGKAFYLTDSIELAHIYDIERAKKLSADTYYIYEYDLDEEKLCCKLEYSSKYCELWEHFISLCQSNEFENVICRAVIGPLKQEVSQFIGGEYIQYALKTQRILDYLQQINMSVHITKIEK